MMSRVVARAKKFESEARSLVYNEFLRDAFRLGLQYKLTSIPQINDPNFVATLVFENTSPCQPKARFAYLFPNCDAALIQARLRPDLSDAQRTQAISLIRQAVRMKDWRLRGGQQYVVTGAPVVVADLSDSLVSSVKTLLIAALIVMALTLTLVFRSRLRLLPLLIAVAAVAITFGALSAVGASLTMASIGVLPVLLGLSVDYAIQLQSRVQEERGDLGRVARFGAPTIATAAAATNQVPSSGGCRRTSTEARRTRATVSAAQQAVPSAATRSVEAGADSTRSLIGRRQRRAGRSGRRAPRRGGGRSAGCRHPGG